MDFLTQPFKSEALVRTQKEAQVLTKLNFPVLISGTTGSGKTSWALALAKAKGSFLLVESNQAPRSLKEWRVLFQDSSVKVLVFEEIEKWSEPTQNSLSLFFREMPRTEKSIICTSSQELFDLVQDGQFRNDLYHRLNVRPVNLPRISNCTQDVESIAQFWIEVHSLVSGRQKPQLSVEAIRKLETIQWQSDWTEFVSVLERALSYCGDTVLPDHLITVQMRSNQSRLEAGLTLAEMEKKLILQTLKLTASNKSQAARLLGISIRTLRNKLNEYKQEGFHELV